MAETKKQIEYWIHGAESDIETAGILMKKKKYLHGLFFCHLTIEKIVKALVVKATNQPPPRSHNLFKLLENTDVVLGNEDADFLGILMKYQLEGRYPDYNPLIPERKKIKEYFQKKKEMLLWLKMKL